MADRDSKKTLGLDLGIASVGWCLFEDDDDGHPRRIIDLGSFVFDQIEDEKGNTENAARRVKRSMRRQRRRTARRLADGRELFKKSLGIDFLKDVVPNLPLKGEDGKPITPFEIKVRGLKEKLSKAELVVALHHYLKFRGFKSNRKVTDESGNADEKKLLTKIQDFAKSIKEESDRLGRPVYASEQIMVNYRERKSGGEGAAFHNRPDEYNLTVNRSLYDEEIDALLKKQIDFHVIDRDFADEFKEIWGRQRDFSEGPDEHSPYYTTIEEKIGKCRFDGEPRAPKDSITAKRFVLLSALNNLSFKLEGDEEYRRLTREQIVQAEKELIFMKKASYEQLFKKLDIYDKVRLVKGLRQGRRQFGKCIGKFREENNLGADDDPMVSHAAEFLQFQRKCLFGEATFYRGSEAIYALSKVNKKADDRVYEKIIGILMNFKTDARIKGELEKKGYGSYWDAVEKIKDVHGVIDLSLSLCAKLIPHLRNGCMYDEAMEKCGYLHYASIENKKGQRKMPSIEECLKEMDFTLTNPVVKHTLVQVRTIVNAIIDKYGFFDDCVIELSREMRKSFEERKKIQWEQLDNLNRNDLLRNEMIEKFPGKFKSYSSIKKDDLLKYRLFHDQRGTDPYSNLPIDERSIFDDNAYQIDHILPYSRSFDDSYSNKVLVAAKSNQDKGNRLPLEWLTGDKRAPLDAYLKSHSVDLSKRQKLLAKEISDDFINRDFEDSSYIGTLAKDLITFYVLPKDRKCRSVNGQITSKLRDLWRVSGRTHSYASSYDRGLYRRKPMNDYRFQRMELQGEKINFAFLDPDKVEFKLQPIAPKKVKTDQGKKPKELSPADLRHNAMIDVFTREDNFKFFEERFAAANRLNGKDYIGGVDGLQRQISMESVNDLDSSRREAGLYVLAIVRNQIAKDSTTKDRSNHLHHALDAAVIGCASAAIIKRITDAAQRNEEPGVNKETGEINLFLPYPDFREEVLLRVYERDLDLMLPKLNELGNYRDEPATRQSVHILLPVRRPKTNVKGAFSKEAIHGQRNGRAISAIRVDKLTPENVELIWDKEGGANAVYHACKDWLDHGHKTKFPMLQKNGGTPIKKVRIDQGEIKGKVSLSPGRFADNDVVARVDVYKKKNGDGRYFFVPVYYYQIEWAKSKNKSVKYTIIWGSEDKNQSITSDDLAANYCLVARLPRYSLVELTIKDKKPFLCYTGGCSVNGRFEIYSILGDTFDLYKEGGMTLGVSRTMPSVSSIVKIKLRSLSPLGWLS